MTWLPIIDAPIGPVLWLKREQRVTFGRRYDNQWCSWDGGFTRKAPPTHFMIAPAQEGDNEVQAWHRVRDYAKKHGKPGP